MGPEANLCLARAPVHRLGFRASLPHCQKLGLPLGLRANEGLPGDLRRREGEDQAEGSEEPHSAMGAVSPPPTAGASTGSWLLQHQVQGMLKGVGDFPG